MRHPENYQRSKSYIDLYLWRILRFGRVRAPARRSFLPEKYTRRVRRNSSGRRRANWRLRRTTSLHPSIGRRGGSGGDLHISSYKQLPFYYASARLLGLGICALRGPGLFGSSNCNRPPRAEEEADHPRSPMYCAMCLARGREFRMAHSATLRLTNTFRYRVSSPLFQLPSHPRSFFCQCA